jgi:hypothetical protein
VGIASNNNAANAINAKFGFIFSPKSLLEILCEAGEEYADKICGAGCQ